jgi:hypothetical protein
MSAFCRFSSTGFLHVCVSLCKGGNSQRFGDFGDQEISRGLGIGPFGAGRLPDLPQISSLLKNDSWGRNDANGKLNRESHA